MLILAYDYPPNDGGISRLGAGIAAELARRGEAPEVVTLRQESRDGPLRPSCPHHEVAPHRGRREIGTLRRLLTTPRNTPVLATAWNPEATLAVLAGRRRLTILAHGNEVMAYHGRPGRARLRRHVLERARMVVCNSAYTADLVRRAAPGARMRVIHPAVDAGRFAHPQGRGAARARLGLPEVPRIVLSVSRLDPGKGHETVLRAIAGLAGEERAGLLYLVAGKGAHEPALRRMVADLGLGTVVRFMGFVNEADLPVLHAAADLFALCSVEDRARGAVEGFGMAFAEGQSAGLPVLGTRSGGIPDAVREGEGGWLVAERDHEGVLAHLRRLLADPAAFHAEGAKGRARVLRELGWERYVDALMEVV